MPETVAITDYFTEPDPSKVPWTTVLVLPAFVSVVPFVLLLPAVDAFAHELAYSQLPSLVIFMCFIPWLRHILTTARFLFFHSDGTTVSRLCSWLAIAGLVFNASVQVASGIIFDIACRILGPIITEENSVQIMAVLAVSVLGACYGSWYLAHTIKQQRSLSMNSEIATSTILFLASILPAASVPVLGLAAYFVSGAVEMSHSVGYHSIIYAYYFGLALSYLMTFGGLKLIDADRLGSAHIGTQKRSIRQSTR